jgi:hypothetical protein
VFLTEECRQDKFSLPCQFQLMLRQVLAKQIYFFVALPHRFGDDERKRFIKNETSPMGQEVGPRSSQGMQYAPRLQDAGSDLLRPVGFRLPTMLA